jgi:hypothetical protein
MKNKSDEESFNENDEIIRIKLENLRLNEENASLVNSKQKMEAHYLD